MVTIYEDSKPIFDPLRARASGCLYKEIGEWLNISFNSRDDPREEHLRQAAR